MADAGDRDLADVPLPNVSSKTHMEYTDELHMTLTADGRDNLRLTGKLSALCSHYVSNCVIDPPIFTPVLCRVMRNAVAGCEANAFLLVEYGALESTIYILRAISLKGKDTISSSSSSSDSSSSSIGEPDEQLEATQRSVCIALTQLLSNFASCSEKCARILWSRVGIRG